MRGGIYSIKIRSGRESSSLHRYEINKLIGQQKVKGYTIMPLKVYIRDGLVKMEIGLARGKKLYDKREDIAKKDMKREMERDLKSRSKDF